MQIDGADVGSFRQGWAGLYVNFGGDAIQDTQVTTGGSDASAPLGVGVVINVYAVRNKPIYGRREYGLPG